MFRRQEEFASLYPQGPRRSSVRVVVCVSRFRKLSRRKIDFLYTKPLLLPLLLFLLCFCGWTLNLSRNAH